MKKGKLSKKMAKKQTRKATFKKTTKGKYNKNILHLKRSDAPRCNFREKNNK